VRTPFFPVLRSPWRVALALILTFGVIQAARLSRNRAFQVDEMEHVHAAYSIESGSRIYADFFEPHNPLLYLVLQPAVQIDDAAGSFRRARISIFPMLLGTIVFSALAAWRMAGPVAGMLTAGLLVFHSTVVERGMEVRPDGPLAFCIAVALFVETTSLERLRRNAVQALAMGVGFMITQKAAIPCAAFGALWLTHAVESRRPRLLLVPLAVWATPLLLVLAKLVIEGSVDEYVRANYVDNIRSVTGTSVHRASIDALPTVIRESSRNPVFAALALLSLAYLILTRRQQFLVVLALILLAGLLINPFPYPYYHVTIVPTLAVVAGIGAAAFTRRESLAVGLAAIALATSAQRISQQIGDTNARQLAFLRNIEAILDRDDAMIDLAGLYFRPDAYPVPVMTMPMLKRYSLGGFPPMIPYLRGREMVAATRNYRTTSLPPAEREFLAARTVSWDGDLHVLGRSLDGMRTGDTVTFEALKEKAFRFEGAGAISIDGIPFTRGVLARGPHVIAVTADIPAGRLILDVPPAATLPSPPGKLYLIFD
jgi:hypothetical protein